MKWPALCAAVVLALLGCVRPTGQQPGPVIFIAPAVVTADGGATALGMSGRELVAVGTALDVERALPGAVVERWPTAVLMPGLVDVDGDLEALGQRLAPREPLRARLKAAVEACARWGITEVHDTHLGEEAYAVLQSWDAAGALPVRVFAAPPSRSPGIAAVLAEGRFAGRMLHRNALSLTLAAPWRPEELRAWGEHVTAHGLALSVHGQADGALEVLARLPHPPGAPHRIHLTAPSEAEVALALDAGVRVTTGPLTSEQHVAQWRSARRAGLTIAVDLDAEPAPRVVGAALGAGLTLHELVASLTAGAAAAQEPDRAAPLTPGADADFIVLTNAPASPQHARGASVLLTVVGGLDVYRAP